MKESKDIAVSNEGIALTECGHVRYTLAAPAFSLLVHPCTSKTPYRDGTTHVCFDPLDFIARLAALVPQLRVNLTRFHGVFAPDSKLRSQAPQTIAEWHQAMTWA